MFSLLYKNGEKASTEVDAFLFSLEKRHCQADIYFSFTVH